MRFKKQIIYICLFTFLFLPIQFKRNEIEVKAEPITLSYLTYELIALLFVSAGVVITNEGVQDAIVNEFNKALDKSPTARSQWNMMCDNLTNVKDGVVTVGQEISNIVKSVYDLTFSSELDGLEYTKYKSFSKKLVDGTGAYRPERVWFHEYVQHSGGTLQFSGNQYSASVECPPGKYKISLYIHKDSRTSLYVSSYGSNVADIYSIDYQPCDVRLPLYLTSNILSEYAFVPDWEEYRNANKDLNIDNGVANGASICVDNTLSNPLDKLYDSSKQYSYPLTSEQLGLDYTPSDSKEEDKAPSVDIPIDKPSIEDTETPTTGDSLWDTLFGWLKTLLSPLTKLLGSIWDLIKGLFDMLKGLLTSILDLIKSLVQSLIDGIVAIFVPTIALEDVFKLNKNTFFGQVGEVFNFEKLWNLTPKPYEFEVDFPFYDFSAQEQRPYHLEVKFFENKFMKENINLIRNITTYPLLLISIYFVIMHFLPKRDMD